MKKPSNLFALTKSLENTSGKVTFLVILHVNGRQI